MTESSNAEHIAVAGAELYVEVTGDGPAVVLVHAGIADLRMWDEQVPALSERYTVIRYDLRGFGRSRAQPGPFSHRQDLAAVLDHAGVARAAVVGCSLGGMIALDVALELPERVSALVWVCSGVGGLHAPDEVFDPREIELLEQSEAAEEAGDADRAAALDVRIWLDGPLQVEGRAPADLRARVHDLSLSTYRRDDGEGLEPQRLEPPAVDRLTALRLPVLAILGELDVSSTAHAADALVREAPDVRLLRYPDAAHLPNMEHPQRFTRDVMGFLDALPAW